MGWGGSQVQASAKGPYTAVQPLTGLASRFSWNLCSFFSLLPPPSHPPFPSPPPWLMESHSHFSSGIAVGSFLHTPALRTTVQRSSSFLAKEFSPLCLIMRLCLPPAHTPHYWLLSVPWTWQAHSLLNGTATARLCLPWPLRLSVLRWWLHQFHLSLFSYHMNQTQQCWTTCKTGKFGWVSSYVLHWQEQANTKCIWRKLMLNQNRNSSKGSGF